MCEKMCPHTKNKNQKKGYEVSVSDRNSLLKFRTWRKIFRFPTVFYEMFTFVKDQFDVSVRLVKFRRRMIRPSLTNLPTSDKVVISGTLLLDPETYPRFRHNKSVTRIKTGFLRSQVRDVLFGLL